MSTRLPSHSAIVMLAAIAVALTFARPLALTTDSHYYLGAARHFRLEGRFVTDYPDARPSTQRVAGPNGSPFTAWPPLYPALLSVFDARLINAVAFASIVLLAAAMFASTIGAAWLAVLLLLPDTPLFFVTGYVWSETLYIALTLSGIWLATRAAPSGALRRLFVAGILLTLAALTRYVGIVALGWLFVVIADAPLPWQARRRALLVAFGPVLLFAAWLVRNYTLTGQWFGPRPPEPDTTAAFQQAAVAGWNVIRSWAMPMLLVALVALRSQRRGRTKDAQRILLYALLYLVFMVATSAVTTYNTLNARLLSPLYVPLLAGIVGLKRS